MKQSSFVDHNRRQSQTWQQSYWFLQHTNIIELKNRGTHPTLQSGGCVSLRRELSLSRLCAGPPARSNAVSSSWAPRDLTPGIVWARSLTSVSFPPCPQCSSAPRGWRTHTLLTWVCFKAIYEISKSHHYSLNVKEFEASMYGGLPFQLVAKYEFPASMYNVQMY